MKRVLTVVAAVGLLLGIGVGVAVADYTSTESQQTIGSYDYSVVVHVTDSYPYGGYLHAEADCPSGSAAIAGGGEIDYSDGTDSGPLPILVSNPVYDATHMIGWQVVAHINAAATVSYDNPIGTAFVTCVKTS